MSSERTSSVLQHVWSLGPGNISVVYLGWCTMTCTGWLFPSKCSTSLLWQSIVVFGTDLQGISPTTVCQSLKLLIASTCDLPDVVNCQFREFAAALLGTVIFCRRTKSLRDPAVVPEQFRRDLKTYLFAMDIRSVSALEVFMKSRSTNRHLLLD